MHKVVLLGAVNLQEFLKKKNGETAFALQLECGKTAGACWSWITHQTSILVFLLSLMKFKVSADSATLVSKVVGEFLHSFHAHAGIHAHFVSSNQDESVGLHSYQASIWIFKIDGILICSDTFIVLLLEVEPFPSNLH